MINEHTDTNIDTIDKIDKIAGIVIIIGLVILAIVIAAAVFRLVYCQVAELSTANEKEDIFPADMYRNDTMISTPQPTTTPRPEPKYREPTPLEIGFC